METSVLTQMPMVEPVAPRPVVSKRERRPIVLIAEDAADTRLILARTLEFENYRYVQATTGEEAIEKAVRYRPDLILLDLMLPKLNGFQVLMRLKSHNVSSKVCIISALDNEEFIRRALDFGASDYIVKPVFPDAINHKVRSLLGETDTDTYFYVPCSLAGKINIDATSYDCQILQLTEVKLALRTNAPLRSGEVVPLNCPTLNQVLHRDIPIFVRLNLKKGKRPRDLGTDFDGEIVGFSEIQRLKLRAEITRGRYITDEL